MEESSKTKSGNELSVTNDFEKFTQDAFQKLIEGTRAANNIPKTLDWDYYSTFPSFERIMESQSSQILDLSNNILQHLNVSANILKHNLEEKLDVLIDSNDFLLDRVKKNIDVLSGIKNEPEPVLLHKMKLSQSVSGSWNKPITVSVCSKEVQGQPVVRLLAAKNVIRPQTMFIDKIDNSSERPWEPKIKNKPNSIKPLAIFLEETNDDLGQGFSHPYEFELDRFKPPEGQLKPIKPIVPKHLDDVPLVLVDNLHSLHEMYKDLLQYFEIAIDLEHHSYRSFQGITCLMQISTGNTDYLIDTLVLRNDLEILNEVFTKPSIVKIFHGADLDVEWLQRDLSLYIVNMFDTHQAAKLLNYPQLSLAALMKKFCQRDPDKKYQLADWRIRPLPDALQLYAREDTHYLIYIYHMLRNELLQQANGNTNLLEMVINRSTEICKKRYVKPFFKKEGYLDLYRASRRTFDNRQLYALSELYQWRDNVARNEDESLGYVLPTHMMLHIAESLPREVQGILACCNPVPPLVRHHLINLHQIILKARQQPIIQPILKEEPVQRNLQHWNHFDLSGPLHCPHDLSKDIEFRNDLPTLINSENINIYHSNSKCIENSQPKINIFASFNNVEELNTRKKKLQNIKFLCPYERYKLIKEYIKEETKSKEISQEENIQIDKKDQVNSETEIDNVLRMAKLYENVNKKVKELKEVFDKCNEKDQEQSITVSLKAENEVNKHEVVPDKYKRKKRKRAELDSANDDDQNLNTASVINTLTPLRELKKRKCSKTKNSDHNVNKAEVGNKDKILFKEPSDAKQRKIENSTDDKPKLQNPQKKKKNKKGKQNNSTTNVPFKPFDYSSVDFKKFQTASDNTSAESKKKSHFNRKNKKGKMYNKSNNKSFSYGKINSGNKNIKNI